MESITKNPTLGHCTLQRTSLLSWVCGDSYGGDWNTLTKKPAKRICQVLKKWSCLKRFFICIFFYHYPCTHACAHAQPDVHAYSGWWRMMAEAGTEPVSDLSCNLGNRAPIDPLGERPCISIHTHTVKNTPIHTHSEHTHAQSNEIELLSMSCFPFYNKVHVCSFILDESVHCLSACQIKSRFLID